MGLKMVRSKNSVWRQLNWPNRISMLRLLLVAPFVILLLNHHDWPGSRYVAVAIFLVMAVSDLVDGMLARRLDQETRLGAILDPLADKALIICSAILLALPESAIDGARLANWVVVTIVGKDLWMILGFLVIYLVTDRFRVQTTRTGKACTFAQIIMVGLTLIAPDLNRLSTNLGSYLATGSAWIVAALGVGAVISYTRLGITFVAAEEKPLDNQPAENPPENGTN